MKLRVPFFLSLVAICLAFCDVGTASVIFRPNEKEKVKFVAPGDEEISGSAKELFEIAQKAEKESNPGRAIRAYRTLVKKYRRDALAPFAAFRQAELLEETGEYLKAAAAYIIVVEGFPASPHFEEAIEAQFRIGEIYLSGKRTKFLGIPMITSMQRAIEIFAAIVRTAPYGKYTARAQFDIGLTRERLKTPEAALEAYQAVVDKFPNDPIAAQAQYQIGYIWLTSTRAGVKDIDASARAKTAFQDFLFRFPNDEKAPQARANLQQLERKQTVSSLSVAKFYDKQKNYRAAVIYYNEVIRQQPGSAESEQAKKRIDQLRAKVGDAALQPAFAAAEAEKKKADKSEGRGGKGGPAMRGSANDVAPLPPPETDLSLPPPASLNPDTTTAPAAESSPIPSPDTTTAPAAESSPTPETSPAMEAPASAEATASPTP
ncbi:MAG TPA: outer membrane protein assembly factor BamD [Chthoniobacterales bacterium]|nr:outer membrane protein assembly factor BamD [Chthoniobacterales bacterium]